MVCCFLYVENCILILLSVTNLPRLLPDILCFIVTYWDYEGLYEYCGVGGFSSLLTVKISKILHLAGGADIEVITRHSLEGGNPLIVTVQPT